MTLFTNRLQGSHKTPNLGKHQRPWNFLSQKSRPPARPFPQPTDLGSKGPTLLIWRKKWKREVTKLHHLNSQPPQKKTTQKWRSNFYPKLLSVQLCTQTHTEELACLDSLEYSLKYLHFFRECIHSRTRECKLQKMGDAFIDGIIGCSCSSNKIKQNKVQSTSGKSDILPAKSILCQIVFRQEFSNFKCNLICLCQIILPNKHNQISLKPTGSRKQQKPKDLAQGHSIVQS